VKRTFKRADGTEEVLEGTADELAEYERRLREERPPAPKKPGVLKGKGLEDLLREIQSVPERVVDRLPRPWTQPPHYPNPIWVVSCPVCGQVGCGGNHWWPGTFTITLSGTAVDSQLGLIDSPVQSVGCLLGQCPGSENS